MTRKYVKSGKYTKKTILKRKIDRLFNQFWKKSIKWDETKKKEEYKKLKEKIFYLTHTSHLQIHLVNHALDSSIKKYEIINPVEFKKYDPISFLDVCKKLIFEKIRRRKEHGIKIKISLVCLMKKIDHTGKKEEEKVEEGFSNEQSIVLKGTNLEQVYKKIKQEIVEKFEAYQKKGSDWIFEEILKLELYISEYNVTNGSTYFPLPDCLKNKNAIINIKNNDNHCFKWSVTRALNLKKKNNERVDLCLKKYAEKLNWSNVKFPSSFHDIDMFEKKNNIGIILYGTDKKRKIIILRMPKKKYFTQVRLLLISN